MRLCHYFTTTTSIYPLPYTLYRQIFYRLQKMAIISHQDHFPISNLNSFHILCIMGCKKTTFGYWYWYEIPLPVSFK